MKKVITSIMASMMLLCVGSAQAWCEPDYCYDPCAPCDPCFNSEGFYIGAFGGANFLTTDRKRHHGDGHRSKLKFETGYVAAASIGYRWCNNLRAEFEYSYRHNKLKNRHHRHDEPRLADHHHHRSSRNVWSSSYLVNGIWDISWCNDWCLKPFIGAGIGYSSQHLSVSRRSEHHSDSSKKNGFAWQILTGVAYPICDNLDLSVEYRFFKGNLKHVYNQNVGAGLRYYF